MAQMYSFFQESIQLLKGKTFRQLGWAYTRRYTSLDSSVECMNSPHWKLGREMEILIKQ